MSVSGCNYLDINPEMGLDEDQVFTVWDNFKSYYYNIYTTPTGIHCAYPLYLDMNARRYTWYQFTDLSDAGRLLRCQQIKSGTMGENAAEFTTSTAGRAISYSMFRIIRVANKCIENIDMVQNAKQIDKDDLIGQAYFVRAFAHFTLCRIFGGMPYLDKALDENDEWDMARLTAWETYSRCAEDFDRAYECFVSAGKVRRDAAPGTEGHLTSSDMAYPNGVAAKAMKARALLYAASKLNNLHGQSDWEDAAEACGCSQSHFMRWFKKMTGQGFTAYLNDHRLNLAAELLRITDATVLDIAGRVGFDNLSYFNRLFKRRYGMTPREYRSK